MREEEREREREREREGESEGGRERERERERVTHTDTKVQRYRVLLARSGTSLTSVQCMKECWHVSVSICINTTIYSHHHLH